MDNEGDISMILGLTVVGGIVVANLVLSVFLL
jgi:hypothetical protein